MSVEPFAKYKTLTSKTSLRDNLGRCMSGRGHRKFKGSGARVGLVCFSNSRERWLNWSDQAGREEEVRSEGKCGWTWWEFVGLGLLSVMEDPGTQGLTGHPGGAVKNRPQGQRWELGNQLRHNQGGSHLIGSNKLYDYYHVSFNINMDYNQYSRKRSKNGGKISLCGLRTM